MKAKSPSFTKNQKAQIKFIDSHEKKKKTKKKQCIVPIDIWGVWCNCEYVRLSQDLVLVKTPGFYISAAEEAGDYSI